ncbi:anti-sigma factor family protein [Aliiglaciecola lipolytica]|uniref:anti-sigma factor family protein n=1 Tax=Aliiglaciecola lipolytica TaxID=477689 RepID=UPI001C08E20E|nr:hypothetical protein [Aliiglaciecola lipolytica]MBU2877701.1 hypothetical protein [Aliiglaciecola lipolytica]
MNITDEMLSAFLDAELLAEEMEQVRKALENDDELVMRLAEISQVDQWVVENAQQMDQTPEPSILVELARKIDAGNDKTNDAIKNNVVQISAQKKRKPSIKLPYSLAAGVALILAVGVLTINQPTFESSVSADIASILDSTMSGQTTLTTNGLAVKPQLSFATQNGELCRQYQLSEAEISSTNIACKQTNGWHIKAKHSEQGSPDSGSYQTASNQQQLDAVIDQIISGAPLDRAQEQQAIVNQWQSNQ